MHIIGLALSFIIIACVSTTDLYAHDTPTLPKDPPMYVGERYDFTGVICFAPDAILQYFDGPRIAIGEHNVLPVNTVTKGYEAAQLSYQASECMVGHYLVTPVTLHQEVTMYMPTQQSITQVCHYYLIEAISLHKERLVIWSRVPLRGQRQSTDLGSDLQHATYVYPCDNYSPKDAK